MAEPSVYIPVAKLNDEQRLFGGWAYVARMPDGTLVEDHSGDVVDTPEAWDALRKAFIRYALVSRAGDYMHDGEPAASLVEMMIFDAEKREAMSLPEGVLPDGVFTSYKALENPAGERLWKGVKSGSIRALSIAGQGYREDIEDGDDGPETADA